MKAALVQDFDRPPTYSDLEVPEPKPGEELIRVRASALSQLVRAQASGKHYSGGHPPFVPGVDGVGTRADGTRVYFAFPPAPVGAMAEYTVVKSAYCVPLPDDLDDVTAAAIANPGMSSWAALNERAGFQRGQAVLVNGATGASGRLAIQIAKHLGASRVVATGRNAKSEAALLALGADVYVPLDLPSEELRARFQHELARVDVVLDYLYGPSAEHLLSAAAGHGDGEAARRIRFVQVGSLAGGHITLPAAALRSTGLELLGSGLGSLSNDALIRAIASLMQAVVPARLDVEARAVPLAQVTTAWQDRDDARLVFTMR